MNNWKLYSKSGNPTSEIAKKWLINNGIPVDEKSIHQINKENLKFLIQDLNINIVDLIYPDQFSFLLINPQKKNITHYINEILENQYSSDELLDILVINPSLIRTPIIHNEDMAIIGYNLEEFNSTFRFVKVKDVTMA